MNFHWKLLLSEIEVLQLTPLEHLGIKRNKRSSGLYSKSRQLLTSSTDSRSICLQIRRHDEINSEEIGGWRRGPRLELCDQVQTRQSQWIPWLNDLTLEQDTNEQGGLFSLFPASFSSPFCLLYKPPAYSVSTEPKPAVWESLLQNLVCSICAA